MSARERMAQTREAVERLGVIQATIMAEGDDWRPDSPGAGGYGDPTAARAIRNVEEWAARLAELRREETELVAFVTTTRAIIGGVAEGLGEDYAEILRQRYIEGLPWGSVELRGEPVKRSTGKLRVRVACDWIDALGVTRVLAGDYEI